jgi:hypothetical protein
VNDRPSFGGAYTARTVNGDRAGAEFGTSVAGVGDVDGDGRGDLIVGSRLEANGAISGAGAAHVISGATGATLFKYQGDSSGEQFGVAVAGLGDVNGDGRPDYAIGARHEDNNGLTNSGSVHVYSGATGALLYTVNGDTRFELFGSAVAGAGDVDGDGRPDLIVGSPGDNNTGLSASGSARVISGATGATLHTFNGLAAADGFGGAVAGAGDVDGDGRADLIVGAAFVDSGPRFNVGSATVFSGRTGAVLFSVSGVNSGDELGRAVAGAGDVDGDGRADVIVGAPGMDVFFQNAGGVEVISGATRAPLISIYGPSENTGFGGTVASLGDVDGDGRIEVLVGATAAGAAWIYSSGGGGALVSVIGTAGDRLGAAVGAGDLDGDGRADLLVGAIRSDPNGIVDAGSVRLLYSSTLDARPVFTEGGPGVVLDGDADLRDVELDAADSYAGSTLTLARRGGANADDVFAGSGTLSFASGEVLVGGVAVGSYTRVAGTLTVSFTADATSARVDALLRQVTYANVNAAPPPSVTIAYSFDDGTGAVAPGLITVDLVNLVAGDAAANVLTGTANADVLNGGGGDDRLVATAGNDTLNGGSGIDTADYRGIAGPVSVNLALGGPQTITAGKLDTLSGLENIFSGAGADTLTGDAGANQLDGGLGADTMAGGAGNDTYVVRDSGDVIIELAGGGRDAVKAFVSHTLADNVENLTLAGAARGTGNALANVINGSAGAERLEGLGGRDTLIGGGGRDVLAGGADADTFVFGAVSDSSLASAQTDRIVDFSRAEGDKIYLVGIDANTTNAAGTNDAFAFIGSAGFTAGAPGQLRTFFNAAAGVQVVQGDVNGDGRADFQIFLESPTNLGLTASDFLL